MEQYILPTLIAAFVGILAWLGNRFVDQIDKLAGSVTDLSKAVAALQAGHEAIWKRIDSMERQ